MKKYLVLLLFGYVCWGQTVEPIYRNANYGNRNNIYYKDLNNDFEPYVGTWVYNANNITWTIKLQKREMVAQVSSSITYYEDVLVGEYHYQVNGNTIVNTLPLLSNNYNDVYDYNLLNSGIVGNTNRPQCLDCPTNQRRISMHFDEPTRKNIEGLSAGLMLRRITENGIAKIVAILYNRSVSQGTFSDGTPTDIEAYSVPYGTYILTKQP